MQPDEMNRMLDVLDEYIGDAKKVLAAVRYIEGGRNDFPRKNSEAGKDED